jgi:F-type H+-transporting ATPase subunit b
MHEVSSINWWELGWFIFDFVVFLLIIFLLLRKPLKNFLTQRSEAVKRDMEDAEKVLSDATNLDRHYTERLSKIQLEVDKIKSDISEDAKKESSRIVEEAKREAERIKSQAKNVIETEFESAKLNLRREVVDVVTTLTEKACKENLTEKDEQRLINDFINSSPICKSPVKTQGRKG